MNEKAAIGGSFTNGLLIKKDFLQNRSEDLIITNSYQIKSSITINILTLLYLGLLFAMEILDGLAPHGK